MAGSLLTFWGGGRPFASADEVVKHINMSRQLTDANVSNARSLLIFQTSKQHTWLVATERQLHCVLDDVRKDNPRLQWSLDTGELTDDTGNIRIGTSAARSKGSGLVHIGPRRNWLYSKKIFPSPAAIEEAVKKLVDAPTVANQ